MADPEREKLDLYFKGVDFAANVAMKVMEKMVVAPPLERQRLSDEFYKLFFAN